MYINSFKTNKLGLITNNKVKLNTTIYYDYTINNYLIH